MIVEPTELADRFDFHPADTPERQQAHNHVRVVCLGVAQDLNSTLPPSREASLALTAIQEAMMWANAALAVHGIPQRT